MRTNGSQTRKKPTVLWAPPIPYDPSDAAVADFKLLADVTEAIIGAFYMSSGLEAAVYSIHRLGIAPVHDLYRAIRTHDTFAGQQQRTCCVVERHGEDAWLTRAFMDACSAASKATNSPSIKSTSHFHTDTSLEDDIAGGCMMIYDLLRQKPSQIDLLCCSYRKSDWLHVQRQVAGGYEHQEKTRGHQWQSLQYPTYGFPWRCAQRFSDHVATPREESDRECWFVLFDAIPCPSRFSPQANGPIGSRSGTIRNASASSVSHSVSIDTCVIPIRPSKNRSKSTLNRCEMSLFLCCLRGIVFGS